MKRILFSLAIAILFVLGIALGKNTISDNKVENSCCPFCNPPEICCCK
jgi:hypothetical protein